MRRYSFLLGICLVSASMIGVGPKISIITSVYDGDEFIEGFLQDIVCQTIFDQCELIIVNAASPGNEEPIIKEYAQRYSNIIYKKLDTDPGIYGVWNYAIKMARGNYITNANLDDRLSPECYALHAAYLDEHTDVDLVYSDKYLTHTPNETFEKHTGSKWWPSPQASRESMSQCWPCSNPMWRRSLHDRFGHFDSSYKSSGDWEMWLRALEGGAVLKKVEGYYVLYYQNPKGLSTGKREAAKLAEDKRIVEKYGHMWGAATYKTYYATARMLDTNTNQNKGVWPLAMSYYLKAYTINPHRAEPLIRIAQYYVSKGESANAYLFASKTLAMGLPGPDEELVEKELYDYVRYDIVGQVAWYVQEFAVGEYALREGLKIYPDMQHLKRNLEFYVNR